MKRIALAAALAALLAGAAQATEADLLRYVPADADLAALARVDQMTASETWDDLEGLAGPFVGELAEEFDLAIDPVADVKTVAFGVTFPVGGDAAPEDPVVILAVELARPIKTEKILRRLGPQAKVPAVTMPCTRFGRDHILARPSDTVLLIVPKENAATHLRPSGPGRASLAGKAGHVVFEAGMPDVIRRVVAEEMAHLRRRGGRINDPEDLAEFALVYHLGRAAAAAKTLTGSVDLDRAEVLQAVVTFDSEGVAAPLAGLATALAEPLTVVLLSEFNRGPDTAAPTAPLLRAVADADRLRVVADRDALVAFARRFAAARDLALMRLKAMSRLAQLGRAIMTYRADTGRMPAAWADLAPKYVKDEQLRNPRLDRPFPGGDFALRRVPPPEQLENPHLVVLAYERFRGPKPPWPNVMVLFADGHVSRIPAERFKALLPPGEGG